MLIESEVKRLIDDGYDTARAILLEQSDQFERLAKGLLEYETLTGEEIKRVIAGEKPTSDDDAAPPAAGGGEGVVSIPKTRPRKPKAAPDPSPEPLA